MNVNFCSKSSFPINSYKEHSHQLWEIILQLSGDNISQVGNNTYSLSPDDIIVVPPRVPHGAVSDTSYTDIYVQAEILDFSDILVVHDYDHSILNLMSMLHKTLLERDNNYNFICDSLLDAICQYIKRNSKKEYQHKFIYELMTLIYENIDNPEFRINDIANKIGYNIDYIRRCFYKITGNTPHEYLTDLRLSQAKKLLLQETFISIENVAMKCGFNDSFYFSKMFRKSYRMSPREYRKSMQTI